MSSTSTLTADKESMHREQSRPSVRRETSVHQANRAHAAGNMAIQRRLGGTSLQRDCSCGGTCAESVANQMAQPLGSLNAPSLSRRSADGLVQRQAAPPTAAPVGRSVQAACVKKLGGCSNSRDAGNPSVEDIASYNQRCRPETKYTGPDVTPTPEECAATSTTHLTKGDKILIGVLVTAVLIGAVALIILSDGTTAPAVIGGLKTIGDTVIGTEVTAGTTVVGEATAATETAAAGTAAAVAFDADAVATTALNAAKAASSGGKFIQASTQISALTGISAAQKAAAVLSVIRIIGFGTFGALVDHGDFLELTSEDGQYVFKFIVNTTKIMYGKLNYNTGEFDWRQL